MNKLILAYIYCLFNFVLKIMCDTDGWYARPALMSHRHSQMVRQSSFDRSIITIGWYDDPTMIGASLPMDGMPTQRRWLHHHRLMVCRAGVDGCIITA